MTDRLILCFDGTWDKAPAPQPATDGCDQALPTNVFKFYDAVVAGTVGGVTQRKSYQPGIGTAWYDVVQDGAFGCGLDEKIRAGYQWLALNYPDNDAPGVETYILGFSRGAYTARSLVGMIRNIGLLPSALATDENIAAAYRIYRDRTDTADGPRAVAFREEHGTREIAIDFLGVWDTVGALGIPLPALQWLNETEYAFHDTELSSIVKQAYHALATDEHRIDFQATLWTDRPDPNQIVEQVWFVGAHGDVGGGNDSAQLSDIALCWMVDKARSNGLAFDDSKLPRLQDSNKQAAIYDSYHLFLDGLYAASHPPYLRPMGTTNFANSPQTEWLHPTTRSRLGYRPENDGYDRLDVQQAPPGVTEAA
jgi:uncharacterized protein (DUF2235 family)